MGIGSVWPWLLVLAVVLLLFGRGKVSSLMGDVAQGVKSFRRGLADDEAPVHQAAIEASSPATVANADSEKTSANG